MSSERAPSLRIRTPEGICFSLLLAGPAVRFLAMLVDTACIVCGTFVLTAVLYMSSLISVDFAESLLVVGVFLLSLGYGIVLEWFWRGQTPGKRLFRLRVMDEQGLPLQFGQVLVRNLVRTIDMFPLLYLLGGAVCFLSGRNRRLGDIAAGTVVVRIPEAVPPGLNQLPKEEYNSLREYPRHTLRLRRVISGEEASIALRAVLRRDELAPDARGELFGEFADYFRSRAPFPPEASDGISDELYVRDVLAVVYVSPSHGRLPARTPE